MKMRYGRSPADAAMSATEALKMERRAVERKMARELALLQWSHFFLAVCAQNPHWQVPIGPCCPVGYVAPANWRSGITYSQVDAQLAREGMV